MIENPTMLITDVLGNNLNEFLIEKNYWLKIIENILSERKENVKFHFENIFRIYYYFNNKEYK
jgi:hypothetical protein